MTGWEYLLSGWRSQLGDVEVKIEELKETINEKRQKLNLLVNARDLAKLMLVKGSEGKVLMEDAVNDCLNTVFDHEFTFKFLEEYDQHKELRGLSYILEKDGVILENITDVEGAGICSVIDFVLSVCMIILNPFTSNLVIGDEVLNTLSSNSWEKFLGWFVEFCKINNTQAILVTHQQATTGLVYKVELENGETRVSRVSN